VVASLLNFTDFLNQRYKFIRQKESMLLYIKIMNMNHVIY